MLLCQANIMTPATACLLLPQADIMTPEYCVLGEGELQSINA